MRTIDQPKNHRATLRLLRRTDGSFTLVLADRCTGRFVLLESDGRRRDEVTTVSRENWTQLVVERKTAGVRQLDQRVVKLTRPSANGVMEVSWKKWSGNRLSTSGVTTIGGPGEYRWQIKARDGSFTRGRSLNGGWEAVAMHDGTETKSHTTTLQRGSDMVNKTVTTKNDGSSKTTETTTHPDGSSQTDQVWRDPSGQITGKKSEAARPERDASGQPVVTTDTVRTGSDGAGGTVTSETHASENITTGAKQSLTTETHTDASGQDVETVRTSSASDGNGNESMTWVVTDPATGNAEITTISKGADGGTFEHTTVVDANGEVVSDRSNDHPASGSGSSGDGTDASGNGDGSDEDSGNGDGNGDGGDDDNSGGGDDNGGGGDEGGGGGGGGEMPADDGSEEGPTRPGGRVGAVIGDFTSSNDSGGDDDWGEGPQGNQVILKRLTSEISLRAESEEDGSSDEGGLGSDVSGDVTVRVPPGAVDDWGDLNDPRAYVGLVARLTAFGANIAKISSHVDKMGGAMH